MPVYNYKCLKCNYHSSEFVWSMNHGVVCPHCGEIMAKLFTTSNMYLLGREKPAPFKFEPKECNADKDIWKSVIEDEKKGRLAPGELKFWKKEVEKNNPNLIL